MSRVWDGVRNPVAIHLAREARGWRGMAAIVGLVAALVVATGVLQQYWYQYDVYVGWQPRLYYRWFLLLAAAEALLLPAWSGVRAAAIWQRLVARGQLADLAPTQLSPLTIVLGAWCASLRPPTIVLLLATGLGTVAALLHDGTVTVAQVVIAHGVLLAACGGMAGLGIAAAAWLQSAALASSVCVVAAIAATGGVATLAPLYPRLAAPATWTYVALLLNPLAAVATALNWDLLRTPWIYEGLRAADYAGAARVTPWPWETAAGYAVLALIALGAATGPLRPR